jgi:hypothetical protein
MQCNAVWRYVFRIVAAALEVHLHGSAIGEKNGIA